MIAVRTTQPWVTKRPQQGWKAGDHVFLWEGTPTLRLVGLGRLGKISKRNADGEVEFDIRYDTDYLEDGVGIADLRAQPGKRAVQGVRPVT